MHGGGKAEEGSMARDARSGSLHRPRLTFTLISIETVCASVA